MAELELENPQQADAPVDDGLAAMLADAPLMQAELVALELWRIRREMLADPGATKINVGAGQPVEQTVQGNRQDPYNGVVIYNPTPATLSIGFEAGTGYLAPATIPPFTWASFPERFTNLSVATLLPADQGQAIATPVTILRLRVPPAPGAGPLGSSAPQQPLASLAGAAAIAAGSPLDNGFPRQQHSLIVVTSAGVTAGTVVLAGSHDGANYAALGTAISTIAGATVYTTSATGAFRFIRAQITAAITGGTVNATVASS